MSKTRALWVAMLATAALVMALPGSAMAAPNLGPNVIVFSPSMPQAAIQAKLDAIATQQVPNQFGSQRYAIFFKPGTYGSASDPLAFQVGYYEQVAGLGASPKDVVITGAVDSFNQCSGGDCNALDNFWRSLSNVTINFLPAPSFTPSNGEADSCKNTNEMWAVSQAAPMRRVIVNGTTTLFDYCAGSSDSSGGFMSDDTFSGLVINGSQQQWFARNSDFNGGWSNSVWNQVFAGDNGAPPQDFGGTDGNQYTTLATTPVSEEQPFPYVDSSGALKVFVPAVHRDSVGPDYAAGPAAGTSIPAGRFFIADPGTPIGRINAALAQGQDLAFTPGVYHLPSTIMVRRPDTVVLGLGFATLIPDHGQTTMSTADVPGVKISGLIFDAGPRTSPALLEVGDCHGPGGCQATRDPGDPTLLSDVFFRIGGAEAGRTTDALLVNADNTILDDIWAWRADHGNGVGWTSNPADTGVVVNGDNVRAYGLFVEHFQKYEVIWNGENGEDVFFQNEMPYDPPNQSAWMSSPATDGYAAFLVAPTVRMFSGYGMGSYSFFNQGVPIFATQAFQSPDTSGVQFHDLLTIFLNATSGSGGIKSVINGCGGSSTAANPDTPVDVNIYPPCPG
jgi:hypothetical protein